MQTVYKATSLQTLKQENIFDLLIKEKNQPFLFVRMV